MSGHKSWLSVGAAGMVEAELLSGSVPGVVPGVVLLGWVLLPSPFVLLEGTSGLVLF